MRRMAFLFIFILASCMTACGNQSDSDESDSSGTSVSGLTLHTFADDVELCTPSIDSSSSVSAGTSLSGWSAWDPYYSGSVLGKIFDKGNGLDECIHTQIEILDEHIEMVNDFSDDWDTPGEHTIGEMTATVSTTARSVDVPYLSLFFPGFLNVAVDRLITVESGDLTLHMGFSFDGDDETIVEHYEIGTTKAGVYYTVRSGNHRWIWHASVRDRKVQFIWDGDVVDETFRVTECTDSGTNWEVMGGGSIYAQDSEMAFMARNHANNTSIDEYYFTIAYGDFLDDNGDQVTILDAEDTAPDGDGVLSYITQDSDLGGYADTDCLGFFKMTEYPDSVNALAWNN